MSSDKGDGLGGWPPTPQEVVEGLARCEVMYKDVEHIALNKEARGQFDINANFYTGSAQRTDTTGDADKKKQGRYKPEVCHNPKLEQMRRNMRKRHEQSASNTTTC